MDPIEVLSGINVNSVPRDITFSTPMKALSIVNEGTSNLNIKFPNSAFYPIKPYESLDIDAEIPFRKFIAKTDSGQTTLRAIGTRDSPMVPLSEPLKGSVPYQVPQVQYVALQTEAENYTPLFIILALIAVVGITAMVIAGKK